MSMPTMALAPIRLARSCISARAVSSDDVTDAREEVFHEVGANDGFASHNALIGQNGMSLYGGGVWIVS